MWAHVVLALLPPTLSRAPGEWKRAGWARPEGGPAGLTWQWTASPSTCASPGSSPVGVFPGLGLQSPERCPGLSLLGTQPGTGCPVPAGSRALGGGLWGGSWGCLPAPLTPVLTLCFSLCCAQPIPWDLWEVSLLARCRSGPLPRVGPPAHTCTHSCVSSCSFSSVGACPHQPRWQRALWFCWRSGPPSVAGVRACERPPHRPLGVQDGHAALVLGWDSVRSGFLSTGHTGQWRLGFWDRADGRERQAAVHMMHNLAALTRMPVGGAGDSAVAQAQGGGTAHRRAASGGACGGQAEPF